jgi:tight adherence protein B
VLSQLWVIYALVFIAALLGVQGIYLFVSHGRRTQKSVNRRLALTQQLSSPVTVLEALRRERGFTESSNPTLVRWSDFLMQTGMRVDSTRLFLWFCVLTAIFFLIFGFALDFNPLALALAIPAALGSLILFLRIARKRRIARFSEQLPDSIDVIVRGVRAGYPFSTALSLVAREMPDPIGTEFGMTSDEITFGADVKNAISNLYRRVGQEDLLFLMVSINVQTQTGGNLAEILTRLSRLIRNRAKIRLKIKALTAEGRLSAVFLTLMPFILFAVISLINPPYFGDVRDHPLIPPAIVLGLAMLLIGNIMIYRMVNFKY